MAKIVELSGSPGVGKTTIYRAINAKWQKGNGWIPGHHLCPHFNLSLDYIRMFLSYLPKRFKGKTGGTFYEIKMEARKRFVQQYPEYMDACWRDLIEKQKKTLSGLDFRLKKAELLGDQIETIQFLKESKTNKVALLEEGLVHLLDVLSFYDTYEEIFKIMTVMPLPDALVYIHTDLAENVRRLMQRGEFISLHVSLAPNQLEQITKQSQDRRMVINKVLEDQNIPILYIDAKAPIETNSDKVICFLKTLQDCQKL